MTCRVRITRTAQVPDPLRVARFGKAPEVGPRVLFFSGGSALAGLSRELIHYTHNSIHLITPFDSGGSSAKLRQAFDMLAVGDLRNRLMALADQTVKGNPSITRLFAFRFPQEADNQDLRGRLDKMIKGRNSLVSAIPDPLRKIIRTHLLFFQREMPEDFDLRGASIGNLVLVGGFLNNARHIDPVVYLFARLVEARGVVRPVVNQDLHLAARLGDGSLVVGQHLMTGREAPPLASPIKELYLTRGLGSTRPVKIQARDKTVKLISQAELICYPMGSFYSSLIANLLPGGVAQAVHDTDCPKIFIPNTGHDKELPGASVQASAKTLLAYLRRACPGRPAAGRLLNLVLVDSRAGQYEGGLDLMALAKLGVEVVDAPLVTKQSAPYLDPELLVPALLSLV